MRDRLGEGPTVTEDPYDTGNLIFLGEKSIQCLPWK